MPQLLFSGFNLDREREAATVTGSVPQRVLQAAAYDGWLRNAARIVIRHSCSARQSIGGMPVAQGELRASIRAG
jgi:hypothetical protein